jgi:hypothetical protein
LDALTAPMPVTPGTASCKSSGDGNAYGASGFPNMGVIRSALLCPATSAVIWIMDRPKLSRANPVKTMVEKYPSPSACA